MFSFVASESQLINWLVSQTQGEGVRLFPAEKGWKLSVCLIYPGEQPLFCALAQSPESSVSILCLDHLFSMEHLALITPEKLAKKLPHPADQIVYLTSEKLGNRLEEIWEKRMGETPLLVMESEAVRLVVGELKDVKLEFRFTKQQVDLEAVPQILPPIAVKDLFGSGVVPFYQEVFHRLNRLWQENGGKLALEHLAEEACPYWDLLSKADRKTLVAELEKCLRLFEQRFLKGWLEVTDHETKGGQRQVWAQAQGSLVDRKQAQVLAKAQAQALSWLKHEHSQISINEL